MDQTEQTSMQLEKDKRETVAKLSVSSTLMYVAMGDSQYVILLQLHVYFSYTLTIYVTIPPHTP